MSNIKAFSKTVITSAVILLSFNAHALLLEPPGDGTSNVTSASQEEQLLIDSLGLGDVDLDLFYKADFGDDPEETGPFSNSYTTSWILDSEGEPTGADIAWDELSAIACPSCYVAVKDGNNEPAYYFFDISSWDGMETLELRDFWPNNGAISHVSIYGKEMTVQVPEPGTIGLLGLGILGLVTARRKILKSA